MRKRLVIAGVMAAAALWMALFAAQFGLRVAPLSVSGALPDPAPLAAFEGDPPIASAQDWMSRRAPLLRAAFENLIYGPTPGAAEPRIVARRLIDEQAFGGLGRVEELSLEVSSARGVARFALVIATPVASAAPAPVVIAPNFCGNRAALGGRYRELTEPGWLARRCRTPASRALTRAMHGANIMRPPFADLLRDGYAVATFSPGEVAPDDPELARQALARLPDASADRLGAIGAWAWAISRVVDVVDAEPGLDGARVAVFGHSRFGKAALWATALDPRISLVIANQSGRLGASPSRSRSGEPLTRLLERFPHWFPEGASAAEAQSELDQHLLLALIAPRPILLGAARLDRWSDPAGAFRAAEAASPVYELFGRVGLDQDTMQQPNLEADIAMFMRPGGHGVRPRDWDVARAFLRAHFGG